MKPITQNTLFYGDNLPILCENPRVQTLTIQNLLAGKGIDMQPYSSGQTFKQAEKVKKSTGKQEELGI